jgi:hypothetical protein
MALVWIAVVEVAIFNLNDLRYSTPPDRYREPYLKENWGFLGHVECYHERSGYGKECQDPVLYTWSVYDTGRHQEDVRMQPVKHSA